MPMHLTVTIYNSAGEIVRHLYSGGSQDFSGGFQMSSNSLVEGGSLNLSFAGLLQGGGNSVSWNATNDQNQMVTGGIYTVQVMTTDSFGNVQSWTQTVSVIPETLSQVLNIYNSAGELVTSINPAQYMPLLSSGSASVNLSAVGFPDGSKADFSVGGANATGVQFVVQTAAGSNVNIPWNGRSSSGQLVAPGSYMVQLVDDNGSGEILMSKAFQLLEQVQPNTLSVEEGPNPAGPGCQYLVFSLNGLSMGQRAQIKLYNEAGELVGRCLSEPQASRCVLPLASWADGSYIAEIDVEEQGVESEVQFVKVALLR
jgi:flagellar hook assembly protein FlgD